jgi:hypothetical protein
MQMSDNDRAKTPPEPGEVASSGGKKSVPEDRQKPLPDGEAIAEVGDAVGGPA